MYVVSDAISGNVPEITPVELFNVIPDGSEDPLDKLYETTSDGSVAETVTLTEDSCENVPSEPDDVVQVGAALDIMLKVLGTTGFTPSDALIVNV